MLTNHFHCHPMKFLIPGLTLAIYLFFMPRANAQTVDIPSVPVSINDAFAKRLIPFPASPGIVVCGPVPQGASAAVADFGAGCAGWLQLMVGGQPDLGQTPSWNSLRGTRKELNTPHFRLSLTEAKKLSRLLGITHAAIGKVSGTAGRCEITYQLYAVPSGVAVGRPITASGSEEAIASSLPGMAGKMAAALGIASPRIPSKVGSTPADLGFLGGVMWTASATLTDAQKMRIVSLAADVPVAGMLAIEDNVIETGVETVGAINTMLAQTPNNPIIYAEIARNCVYRIIPHRDEFLKLCTQYPHNYLLAASEAFADKDGGQISGEVAASERAVRCAPRNPDAWIKLGDAVHDQSDMIRHGRFYSSMSAEEIRALEPLYPRCFRCARRAMELDPSSEPAWYALSVAATFDGEDKLADSAYARAMHLDPTATYDALWGLEIYQPKWFDDKGKLEAVAEKAANAHYDSISAGLYAYERLYWAGKTDLAKKLITRIAEGVRKIIRERPYDAQAHCDYALMLREAWEREGCLAEFQTYVRLRPNSARAHAGLASALMSNNQAEHALAECREAIRLDPEDPSYYAGFGYQLNAAHQYDEAEKMLLEAIRIDPNFDQAHVGLGEAYGQQNDFPKAIAEFRRALEIKPGSTMALGDLTWVLMASGDDDGAIATGQKAVALNTKDYFSYDNMADAYLHRKDYDTAAMMSQKALAINDKDPLAHLNLGEAYNGQGKRKEAREEWKTVLTLEPTGREADEANARLSKYP